MFRQDLIIENIDLPDIVDIGTYTKITEVMPQSHRVFLAFAMHSRWKLTSIRRCSGGITEPSANNLNSWVLVGEHFPMPKIFNAYIEIFCEPLAMFRREKC